MSDLFSSDIPKNITVLLFRMEDFALYLLSALGLKLFQVHVYLSWSLCKQRGSATSRCKGFMVVGGGEAAFSLDAFRLMPGSGFGSRATRLTMALLIPSPCHA